MDENALAPRVVRPEYIPGRIDDPNYVRIFDTTLRDGEQSPGATLTVGLAGLAKQTLANDARTRNNSSPQRYTPSGCALPDTSSTSHPFCVIV